MYRIIPPLIMLLLLFFPTSERWTAHSQKHGFSVTYSCETRRTKNYNVEKKIFNSSRKLNRLRQKRESLELKLSDVRMKGKFIKLLRRMGSIDRRLDRTEIRLAKLRYRKERACETKRQAEEVKIKGAYLVDAINDVRIAALRPGSIFKEADLPEELSIEVITSEETKSVELVLNKRARIENYPPFSLFGDNSVDDYFGRKFSGGMYRLQATPYSNLRTRGQAGEPLTIDFVIEQDTSEAPRSTLHFYATNTGKPQLISQGTVIDQTSFGNKLGVLITTDTTATSLLYAIETSGSSAAQDILNKKPFILPTIELVQGYTYIHAEARDENGNTLAQSKLIISSVNSPGPGAPSIDPATVPIAEMPIDVLSYRTTLRRETACPQTALEQGIIFGVSYNSDTRKALMTTALGMDDVPGLKQIRLQLMDGQFTQHVETTEKGSVLTLSRVAQPIAAALENNQMIEVFIDTVDCPAGAATGLLNDLNEAAPSLVASPTTPDLASPSDSPDTVRIPGVGGSLPQLPVLPDLTEILPQLPTDSGFPGIPTDIGFPGNLPIGDLPIGGGFPGIGGGGFPTIPSGGGIPGIGGGLPQIPGIGGAGIPGIGGGLPQIPGIGGGGIPGIGGGLPQIPGIGGGGIPGIGGGIPQIPDLGGNIPQIPGIGGIPGIGDIPGGGIPGTPGGGGIPGIGDLPIGGGFPIGGLPTGIPGLPGAGGPTEPVPPMVGPELWPGYFDEYPAKYHYLLYNPNLHVPEHHGFNGNSMGAGMGHGSGQTMVPAGQKCSPSEAEIRAVNELAVRTAMWVESLPIVTDHQAAKEILPNEANMGGVIEIPGLSWLGEGIGWHWFHTPGMLDDFPSYNTLVPDRPEQVIYMPTSDGYRPVGVMFVSGNTPGPQPGGCLTVWHNHTNQPYQGFMMHLYTFGNPKGPYGPVDCNNAVYWDFRRCVDSIINPLNNPRR